MSRTLQQQQVIDTVKRDDVSLVKVKACAGSGKTYTLVELAKELQPQSGIYLAYNKGIADEASEKFKGTNMKCSTIHSLAYNAVVRQYGLKVGFFGPRDVQPSTMRYTAKATLVKLLEDFFLSAYVDPILYLTDNEVDTDVQDSFMEHLNMMTNGEISCSHSFYLKLYHVYMDNGTIPSPSVDLLMLDEFGDITALTLDIFRLINAKKKIAVGDPLQNIYSFNKTINGFHALANEGIQVDLSESFRVADHIAESIEGFVHSHLDATFEFKGRKYTETLSNPTKAYIARNNSGLLEEMFRLMEDGIPFNTTRPIDTILELPLILANLGNGSKITKFQYKHLETLRGKYFNSLVIQGNYSTVQKYVMDNMRQDDETERAFKVVLKHGPKDLNALAKYVNGCKSLNAPLTLTTAHSSKGLEYTEVEIAPDLNDSTRKALAHIKAELKKGNPNEVKLDKFREELRLYYVSTTRAMAVLTNATVL